MTSTDLLGGAPSFSAPVLAALSGPLEPIVRELKAAGFFLYDNGDVLGLEGFPDPPAIWAADFQNDPGHLGVVVSITSRDRDWGLSIKASACGLNGGVCYWAPDEGTGQLLASDPHWPGLTAAVLKAQDMAAQHREATSGREPG